MVEKPLSNKFIDKKGHIKGLGYLKSLNSHKDFSIDNVKVRQLLKKIPIVRTPVTRTEVDFRNEMTPVRDQDRLGSCTAFAVSALVEYFTQKTHKKYTPISTLFTYKATRNLMKVTGDTGAYMRSVMGSVALFGTPPEEYWEYNIKRYDVEPTPYCYAFAQNFQSVRYIRLDRPNFTGEQTLNEMKKFVSRKIPVMFGFTCFDSLYQTNDNGGFVPFPTENENMIGGHAITVCGYDDNIEIENNNDKSTTKGAFIFKNSWGNEWGDSGYGYIPYKYFTEQLADDCWTLLNQEWLDYIQFQE